MAERDGTIVIDTQIDTKGVDAGSEKQKPHCGGWQKR